MGISKTDLIKKEKELTVQILNGHFSTSQTVTLEYYCEKKNEEQFVKTKIIDQSKF